MLEIKENESFATITFTLADGDKVIDEYTVDKTVFQDYFNKDIILRKCLVDESFNKLRMIIKAKNQAELAIYLFGNTNSTVLEELSKLKHECFV